MNRAIYIAGLQTLLLACVANLAVWVQLPALGLAGLCVLGLSILFVWRKSGADEARWRGWRMAAAWGGTMLVPFSLATATVFTLDSYYALLAWGIAAAISLAVYRNPRSASASGWKILTMAWAFAGSLIWLTFAYLENLRGAFYAGLLICVLLLILCRVWFHLGWFGIQVAHTLILFLVGLPIVDWLFRPPAHFTTRPEGTEKYYQYELAKKDPAAFARWWKFYMGEWRHLENKLFVRGREIFYLRPKPNSFGTFFDSQIAINSRGFRGKEISTRKNGAYRIIALGGSTTFGVTMTPVDKPWPRLLAEIIRQRLNPARRIEVINAGVPTYSLGHTLARLASDILPLKPDMIISYHGYNGFPMLYRTLPPVFGRGPPRYRLRPIKLLADCEYRFKLFRYRERLMAGLVRSPPAGSDPMQSDYARAYQKLIAACRTNHIRLVLANFSMAVNSGSPNDVVQFYRVPFPAAYWQIKANAAHSKIVRQLARQHPEVCFVDTHAHLDGEHDKFVDLIHLAQDGREQLAENMFAAMENCLLQELNGGTGVVQSHDTGNTQ